VVSIKATPGFVSEEEQFKIFGEVEEEIFRATISFSDAVPKSAFGAVGSEFGIEVTYVSYEHLDGTAQAGSFSDPVDLDELENKLELEGDRIIGITFFSGTGKTDDWIRLINSMSEYAPELNSVSIRGLF
jgi:hypothetical protein